ncbi:hypothetical protein DFH11DRAFT_1587014 [Phellopilus nigrolimitatus]|nr:hypothetical protein DFH11DRAFT_1587014 [Phellopilus nigrolimitatus]
MFTKLFIAAALLHLSWAFSDSAPLVAWSTHKNALVDAFSGSEQPQIDSLLSNEELCRFDAVIIIDQPGLHAHDLKSLSPSSALPSRLKKADKSIQVSYGRRHASDLLTDAARALAHRCGSRIHWHGTDGEFNLDASRKHVLHIALPSIAVEGPWRKHIMSELEESLDRSFAEIELTFPSHLFVYTGSESPGVDKRQPAGDNIDLPFSFAPSNGTDTSSVGILQRYQLLTPGLIISLLVAFFLLVPIIMLAIQALASIQSSVRLDAPKGSSVDKKSQ